MRHLWSLLAGVVVAPVTWVLIALGQDGSTRAVDGWLSAGRYDTADLVRPASYLAAAAIVLGLLATLRFSPLGPVVAGLLLAAPYAALFVNPFAVRDGVPANWSLLGDRVPLLLPLRNGTLALLGVLLLMAVFSRHRWRRWPAPAAAQSPAEGAAEGAAEELTAPADEPSNRPDDEPAGVPAMAGALANGPAANGDVLPPAQPVSDGASGVPSPAGERLAGASRLGSSFRRRPSTGPTARSADPVAPTAPAPIPTQPTPRDAAGSGPASGAATAAGSGPGSARGGSGSPLPSRPAARPMPAGPEPVAPPPTAPEPVSPPPTAPPPVDPRYADGPLTDVTPGPPSAWPPEPSPAGEETPEPRRAPRQATPTESPWTAPPRSSGRGEGTTG